MKMPTHCHLCGKPKIPAELVPSYSPFHPSGRTSLCYSCTESMVDGQDLNQVDRWCQFANMAFLPDEWRKLFRQHSTQAFKRYAESYHSINYYKYDWSTQNAKLIELAKKGTLEFTLEELQPQIIAELKQAWGDLPQADLLKLETLFNDSLQDYTISSANERDMLRKICRLSLMIDLDFNKNVVDKDKLGEYNKLMTSLQKVVEKNEGNKITSLGQILAFIEQNGYKPNFYDGIPRDELDLLERNIKEHITDAVLSAVNISEVYEQRKLAYSKGENEDNPEIEDDDDEEDDDDDDEE